MGYLCVYLTSNHRAPVSNITRNPAKLVLQEALRPTKRSGGCSTTIYLGWLFPPWHTERRNLCSKRSNLHHRTRRFVWMQIMAGSTCAWVLVDTVGRGTDDGWYSRPRCSGFMMAWGHIYTIVQDCSISIANALDILQSCTKPSILHTRLHFKMRVSTYRASI